LNIDITAVPIPPSTPSARSAKKNPYSTRMTFNAMKVSNEKSKRPLRKPLACAVLAELGFQAPPAAG
jgi:hypothetical protein